MPIYYGKDARGNNFQTNSYANYKRRNKPFALDNPPARTVIGEEPSMSLEPPGVRPPTNPYPNPQVAPNAAYDDDDVLSRLNSIVESGSQAPGGGAMVRTMNEPPAAPTGGYATGGVVNPGTPPGVGPVPDPGGISLNPMPFSSIIGKDPRTIGDPERNAYLDFLTDPQDAAVSLLQQQGYDPNLNPFSRRMAGSLARNAVLDTINRAVSGGDTSTSNVLEGVISRAQGGNLQPNGSSMTSSRQLLGDLNALLRNASDPATFANMTPLQTALVQQLRDFDAQDWGDFMLNMYQDFLPRNLRQPFQRGTQSRVRDFASLVAPGIGPGQPSGVLDWLTGSMGIPLTKLIGA